MLVRVADAIGKVLSTSFIGGPRDKRRRYMDAMALVRKYGKPNVFLTMTCNPNWDEIRQELYPGQTPQDRPDLVVRAFRAKLEELKNKLLQKGILGKVRAYVYVAEFQKGVCLMPTSFSSWRGGTRSHAPSNMTILSQSSSQTRRSTQKCTRWS